MCKYMYHDIKLQEPLVCKCVTNNLFLKTQNVAYKWDVLLVCNSAVMVILFLLKSHLTTKLVLAFIKN